MFLKLGNERARASASYHTALLKESASMAERHKSVSCLHGTYAIAECDECA
jgi:hypothetical protein